MVTFQWEAFCYLYLLRFREKMLKRETLGSPQSSQRIFPQPYRQTDGQKWRTSCLWSVLQLPSSWSHTSSPILKLSHVPCVKGSLKESGWSGLLRFDYRGL